MLNLIFTTMRGFLNFIREQGVVGLAVGFILGGAVSKLVASFVADIINPILGLVIGRGEGLKAAVWNFYGAEIMYGNMLAVLIDFIVIALVVYVGVNILRLNKLDKKKES